MSRHLKRTYCESVEEFLVSKPEYYFENGLRKVRPYFFEYQSYAKERWYGRSIADVFAKEFRDQPAEYYPRAIEMGAIKINGSTCTANTLLGPNDLITHRIHRHEPPVLDTAIDIVYRADDMIVVNKPPSIPVHPSGRYQHNTLINILRHEHDFKHISVINRLDRLVSGLVILAIDPKQAAKLHRQMEQRELQKEYICRVQGEFPAGETRCDEPIQIVEHKLGLCGVLASGKPCSTIFTRLGSDGKESVVKCQPLTGRSHQIRVHLQHLGHPIANDPLYNNANWKDRPSAGGYYSEASLKDIAARIAVEQKADDQESSGLSEDGTTCPLCQFAGQDPEPSRIMIYLHAFRYGGPGWSYQVPLPPWAKDINVEHL